MRRDVTRRRLLSGAALALSGLAGCAGIGGDGTGGTSTTHSSQAVGTTASPRSVTGSTDPADSPTQEPGSPGGALGIDRLAITTRVDLPPYWPTAMATSGDRTWVIDFEDKLLEVSFESGAVTSFLRSFDGRVTDMTFDGSNVWVARSSGTLQALDPDTGRENRSISANILTGGLAWDGTHLLVGGWDRSRKVARVDPESGERVSTVSGGSNVASERFTWLNGSCWWVSDERLRRLDPSDGTTSSVLELDARGYTGIASGDHLRIGTRRHLIAVDSDRAEITSRIVHPHNTVDLAWQDGELWHLDYSGFYHRIDPADGRILESFRTEQWRSGLTWGNGRLWTADPQDGSVQHLTPGGGLTDQFSNPAPYPTSLGWGGGRLWITNSPPDLSGGFVRAVDPGSGQVLHERRVSGYGGPYGLAWRDGQLWVGRWDEPTIHVWQDGTQKLGTLAVPQRMRHQGFAWGDSALWIAGDTGELLQTEPE